MKAWDFVLAGLTAASICLVMFVLAGVPLLQRGPWAASCFICCACFFCFGVAGWRLFGPDPKNMDPPAPSDQPTMRTAILTGVLEAIKGIVSRQDEWEKRLKEMENRLSELALTAGLKPRSRRDMGAPDVPMAPKP